MFFTLIKWKWLISLIIAIGLPNQLCGQLVQPARYEVEIKDASEQFHIVANQDAGLLLFKSKILFDERLAHWQFIKLDPSLNELWRQEIKVDPYLRLGLYKTYKEQAYFLFTIAASFNLKILAINLKTGTPSIYGVKNHIPININTFEITSDAILIGGHYRDHPVVLFYDLLGERSYLLPNVFSVEGELNHISTNADNSIDVVTTGMDIRRNKVMNIYSFDNRGKMKEKKTLLPDGKMALQFGRIISHDNRKIIAGTYGRRRSEYSRGLFIAELYEDQKEIKYYNYADLANFFEYLKANRVRRIKDRIERRKKAGKKLRFNYRLLVHDILKSGDEYILLAEAFYPKYKTYNHYSAGFSPYHMSNLVFDGYRYTHAVLVGFNSDGKITWDNYFEINDVERYTLGQVVEVSAEDEKILLYYNNENDLNTKIINKNDVVQGKLSDQIQLKNDNDMVKNTHTKGKCGVIKWDDQSFYAYGVQKITNVRNEGIKLDREVFFINKVIYK